MTSGRQNTPQQITCEHCGSTALWTGGRRRRYCTKACYYKAKNPPKPKRPRQLSPSRQWTERSRQLKIERGNCTDCGLTITEHNVYCIDWDHRDPTTKTFTISYMAGRLPLTELEKETAKCDAVCRNCHALRTHYGQHWQNKPTTNQPNRGKKQWQKAVEHRNTKPQDDNS